MVSAASSSSSVSAELPASSAIVVLDENLACGNSDLCELNNHFICVPQEY